MKADAIADAHRAEVQVLVKNASRPPKLVGILSTSSMPSRRYAEYTRKNCEALGVKFVLKTTGAAESKELEEGEGVEEAITGANDDASVDGILVRCYLCCC